MFSKIILYIFTVEIGNFNSSKMLKRFILSIAICIIGISMTSCFHEADYRYVISNKSSDPITIVFLPQNWAEWELERGELYWGYPAVYLLGNGYKKIDYYKSPFELKPGESLMFSYVQEYSKVRKNPDNPLWQKDHLIDKILIGNDIVDSQKEIPEDYWSNRNNWIMREKETEYVEYWLDIDDNIINNNYTPINNHR